MDGEHPDWDDLADEDEEVGTDGEPIVNKEPTAAAAPSGSPPNGRLSPSSGATVNGYGSTDQHIPSDRTSPIPLATVESEK